MQNIFSIFSLSDPGSLLPSLLFLGMGVATIVLDLMNWWKERKQGLQHIWYQRIRMLTGVILMIIGLMIVTFTDAITSGSPHWFYSILSIVFLFVIVILSLYSFLIIIRSTMRLSSSPQALIIGSINVEQAPVAANPQLLICKLRLSRMRKAVLILSVIDLVCASIAVAWTWMRIRIGKEPFIGQPSTLFDVIGILLYISALVLFAIRMFQQHRIHKRQGMQLAGRDLFRRIAGARPYQREAWLEGSVILNLALCTLISHSIQLIIGYNVIPPFDFEKYESLQNTISLTIQLVLPLSMLLYALFSKDLQTLVKEKKGEDTYDTI